MTKYYTRACNFYYGTNAKFLIKKNAKAKAMPGKGKHADLKLYRVWKESSEARTEEDIVTQAGSGKVTATGAAATEFVERAVQHHQKRADIHEWHKDKGLTDDEAEPEEGIETKQEDLNAGGAQSKKNGKRKSRP